MEKAGRVLPTHTAPLSDSETDSSSSKHFTSNCQKKVTANMPAMGKVPPRWATLPQCTPCPGHAQLPAQLCMPILKTCTRSVLPVLGVGN